ncbi:unnamed protein product [Boreogadus saida]
MRLGRGEQWRFLRKERPPLFHGRADVFLRAGGKQGLERNHTFLKRLGALGGGGGAGLGAGLGAGPGGLGFQLARAYAPGCWFGRGHGRRGFKHYHHMTGLTFQKPPGPYGGGPYKELGPRYRPPPSPLRHHLCPSGWPLAGLRSRACASSSLGGAVMQGAALGLLQSGRRARPRGSTSSPAYHGLQTRHPEPPPLQPSPGCRP